MGRIVKANELKSKPISIRKDAIEAAKTLVEARRAAVRMREDSRNDIIDLALHMASKIVGQTVETNPAALDSIYRQAISSAKELDKAIVHVHPIDHEASNIDKLAQDAGFDVVDDDSLERAGCRITAHGAEVDATITTALELFASSMKGTELGGE